MEYEMHFVHAPSASGKTTFLKTGTPSQLTIRREGQDLILPNTLYRHGNIGVVDGDDIIHFTIGWPPNKAWWQQRGATYVHAANLFAIVNTALRLNAPSWMKHFVIMFNGGMKQLGSAENLYMYDRETDSRVTFHHHTVLPTREIHERNIEARKQENLAEGRSWSFPRNWGDANNNRESVQKLAAMLGVGVSETFEEALMEIDSSYSSKTNTESVREKEEASPSTDWEFKFAARGYKDSDPPNGGSTRIVWENRGWFLVLKLFDDGGVFPAYPRTIKFWRTPEFSRDHMKWTSAAHSFIPSKEEMATYLDVLRDMWKEVPKEDLDKLWT